jgi:hypothetical protein
MQLMMEEVQLMGWLRSIKHYFLLDQVGRGGARNGLLVIAVMSRGWQ